MAGEAVLENPDVIVGCDAIVLFNGIVAGFAKDIDLEENFPRLSWNRQSKQDV